MKFPFHIERTENSHIHDVDFDHLQFGKNYGDHMFVAECRKALWTDCKIIPFGSLPFSPASSALHYGQIIFEGMKAYKDQNGRPMLFRPEQNFKRFNTSAQRMGMATMPLELWLDALHELVFLDQDWIPQKEGCSLYIRPFMFATDRFIGIRRTEFFKFIIITSPSSTYYAKAVKVLVSENYVRAFPGGVGFAKAAGNYGATMLPLIEAQQQGFDQVLWTNNDGPKFAQEIGTMNVFFIIDGVAVTPELDGTILDGVTRASVIQLLKSYGMKVEERKVFIDEVANAHEKGLLEDAFGTGTAADVIPISHMGYKGKTIEFTPVNRRTIYRNLYEELESIKTGKIKDPFGWMVPVKSKMMIESFHLN